MQDIDKEALRKSRELVSSAGWHEMRELDGNERIALAIPAHAVLGIVTKMSEDEYHWESRPVDREKDSGASDTQEQAKKALYHSMTLPEIQL